MPSYDIRPLDLTSNTEVDHVCVYSLMTLWESRPEMRVGPSQLPHFGFEEHKQIILAGADSPNHQFLVARDADLRVIGHSIAVIREGEAPYGYLWSRYVLPAYRRQGISRDFLNRNLAWMRSRPVAYCEVHVHVDNMALRGMYERAGFKAVDRRTERWTYLVYRHDLL